MTELSYNQKRDLVQQLEEALSYDSDRRYPHDTAWEIVDSWLPVYYNEIVDEWYAAGCPDPDDLMPETIAGQTRPIHHLMTLGLFEIAQQFASGAIWSNETGEANTHAEALENLRNNYPEHIRQPA
jgi:hypothetical protein